MVRPRVYANFVSSVDGVVALPDGGESGSVISGRNEADRFVMALLRASADAVLIGAETFRRASGDLWNADHAYPEAADLFAKWITVPVRAEAELHDTPGVLLAGERHPFKHALDGGRGGRRTVGGEHGGANHREHQLLPSASARLRVMPANRALPAIAQTVVIAGLIRAGAIAVVDALVASGMAKIAMAATVPTRARNGSGARVASAARVPAECGAGTEAQAIDDAGRTVAAGAAVRIETGADPLRQPETA